MNKLTKAAIAGAAGIALLLGGAGSLAYWNDSATLGGASIEAGTLSIEATGTASTTYAGTTDAVDLIVPGDEVEVSQGVTISATGDHLRAALAIDEDELLGSLKDLVTVSYQAYDSADAEVTGLDDLTAAEAASIAKVVVTVDFPETVGDTDGDEGQGGTLNLGSLVVTLTQIANS